MLANGLPWVYYGSCPAWFLSRYRLSVLKSPRSESGLAGHPQQQQRQQQQQTGTGWLAVGRSVVSNGVDVAQCLAAVVDVVCKGKPNLQNPRRHHFPQGSRSTVYLYLEGDVIRYEYKVTIRLTRL